MTSDHDVLQSAIRTPPSYRLVLHEQVRAVASALRMPAVAACVVMGIAVLLTVIDFLRGHGGVDFEPQLSMIPAAVGALLPVGVWRREERIGAGFFWMLPVDRRAHALIKVLAGWICLMSAVLIFTLILLVLAVSTTGDILRTQELLVLPSATVPADSTLSRSALHTVMWSPTPLFWLVPFTAATGTYVISSAFALGTRYPLRWMIGGAMSALLTSVSGAVVNADWLKLAPSRAITLLHESRFGLDALMTARTESLKTAIKLVDGSHPAVWRGLPDVTDWILATALWWTLGGIALLLAASRHREQKSSSRIGGAD